MERGGGEGGGMEREIVRYDRFRGEQSMRRYARPRMEEEGGGIWVDVGEVEWWQPDGLAGWGCGRICNVKVSMTSKDEQREGERTREGNGKRRPAADWADTEPEERFR